MNKIIPLKIKNNYTIKKKKLEPGLKNKNNDIIE